MTVHREADVGVRECAGADQEACGFEVRCQANVLSSVATKCYRLDGYAIAIQPLKPSLPSWPECHILVIWLILSPLNCIT
jgi:hypothetical protein